VKSTETSPSTHVLKKIAPEEFDLVIFGGGMGLDHRSVDVCWRFPKNPSFAVTAASRQRQMARQTRRPSCLLAWSATRQATLAAVVPAYL
jgi:hypothetical protein